MAMKLYRCLNCSAEFEADRPACAKCDIDPAKDPRDKDIVVPLVLIHFDPPGKRVGQGAGHAACDPKIRVGSPKCAFSGEPTAVNCAACKATAVYIAQDGDSYGSLAMPLSPNPKGG